MPVNIFPLSKPNIISKKNVTSNKKEKNKIDCSSKVITSEEWIG